MKIAKTALWLAVPAAMLVLVASAAGLVLKSTYARETPTYALQGIGQDIENIVAALTLLVMSYLVASGWFKAHLIWAGALLALIYSYAIYAFAVHFNGLFLVYVAILGLSFYALVASLISLPRDRPLPAFASLAITRTISGFLLLVALFFALQWLREDIPALLSGSVPASVKESGLLTNPVHVLDLSFVLPAMIITAILLWRRQPLGALFAVPLLVFSFFTVLGILAIFVVTNLRGPASAVGGEMVFGAFALVCLLLTVIAVHDMRVPSRSGSHATHRK
ncbi:MAG TPA: hypothetical protein VGR57_11935 [Ktedonobacterales bacterium]|nr:hypothetical protein [Ktedonobacterales bacterium]